MKISLTKDLVVRCFHPSYEEARHAFLTSTRHLKHQSFFCPAVGKNGEILALDVALAGDVSADNLLIVSSGCHGVEGFCGSGVQLACLAQAEFQQDLQDKSVAVLYLHALNPYGFSHIGRCTQENIDLNRNFLGINMSPPNNHGYRMLHQLLMLKNWPPPEFERERMLYALSEMDMSAVKAVLERGQYHFPDGLFYGGKQACWSNGALREVLRTYCRERKVIAWIDIHSGLGEYGGCERSIFARQDSATVARVNAWWNPTNDQHIASDEQGTSLSSVCDGLMYNVIYEECPSVEYAGITLEFGTVSLLQVLAALQAEQWKRSQQELPTEIRNAIDEQIMQAFFCDALDWKHKVLKNSIASILQAVEALSCGYIQYSRV